MPIEVQCSACQAKLRIPDNLAGKTVRCTHCKAEFTAAENVEVEVVEEVHEVDPAEEAVEVVDERPKPRPPAEKRYRRPEREPEPEDDEEEEDRPRRRRKRKARSSPYDRCQWPAFGLLMVGYLGGGLSILVVIGNLGFNLVASAKAAKGTPAAELNPIALFGGAAVSVLVCLVWSGIIVRGANCMSALSDYKLALAGCIVAMLPCSVGCLFGFPIGIWGLIVLMQTDVQKSFG
jgi:predicted Zn finger-like uncharacterized protein